MRRPVETYWWALVLVLYISNTQDYIIAINTLYCLCQHSDHKQLKYKGKHVAKLRCCKFPSTDVVTCLSVSPRKTLLGWLVSVGNGNFKTILVDLTILVFILRPVTRRKDWTGPCRFCFVVLALEKNNGLGHSVLVKHAYTVGNIVHRSVWPQGDKYIDIGWHKRSNLKTLLFVIYCGNV